MENIVKGNNDVIGCNIASILQRLIAIKEAAANDYSRPAFLENLASKSSRVVVTPTKAMTR